MQYLLIQLFMKVEMKQLFQVLFHEKTKATVSRVRVLQESPYKLNQSFGLTCSKLNKAKTFSTL